MRTSRIYSLTAISLLLAVPGSAATSQGYVDQFGAQAIQFVSQQGGLFVPFGLYLFCGTALFALITFTIRQIPHVIRHHHALVDLEGFFIWLLNVMFGVTLLTFWATPVPGVGLSVCEFIPVLFKGLAAQVDQTIVVQFFQTLTHAFRSTPIPNWPNVVFGLVFCLVIISLVSMSGIVFVIEATAYFGMAVFMVCGPLTVWSLMTKTQSRRFWNIIDNLIVFAAYRLVGSICMYLYCHSIVDFFSNTFNGNYTLGNWLSLILPTAMYAIGMVWAMVNVPVVARSLCGGTSIGALAEAFGSSARNVVGLAVRYAMAS